MSNQISNEAITELLLFQGQPCLSIYLPTPWQAPDSWQNSIRFCHLVKRLTSLTSRSRRHAPADAMRLLEPFEALGRDTEFWRHTRAGLAVMGGEGLFRVYPLQRPVPELALVEDSFQSAIFINRWTEVECMA